MNKMEVLAILSLLFPAALSFAPTSPVGCAASSLHAVLKETSACSGPVKTDMNRYNLGSLEEIAEEWQAVVKAETSFQEAGIYLEARWSNIMADSVTVSFPRRTSLGLELLELAGGRQDGRDITVVSNVVNGGAAAGSGVLPGDSVTQIEVKKRVKEQGAETLSTVAIDTECLDYDGTVNAIVSLPEIKEEEELIVLTLKRLRRKPKVTLTLRYPPEMDEPDSKLELFAGENLRRAMLTRGVKLNDKLAQRFDSGGTGDCGAEGTCATCAVEVVKGKELLSPQGIQEEQIFRKKPRWRMACKAVVGYGMQDGDLELRVSPRQWV